MEEEAARVSDAVVCCASSSWSDTAPNRDEITDEVEFDGGIDADADVDAPFFKRSSTVPDVAVPADVPLVSGPTDQAWEGGKVVAG